MDIFLLYQIGIRLAASKRHRWWLSRLRQRII